MNKILLNEESKEFETLKKEWHNKANICHSMQDFEKLYTEIFDTYEHDYGTICHAMVVIMRAAFRVCDHSEQGGITGYQASCVMWEFLRSEFFRTNRIGLRLIDFDKVLYPQYDDYFKITISQNQAEKLKNEAKTMLALEKAHPAVIEHWEKITKGEIPFGIEIKD